MLRRLIAPLVLLSACTAEQERAPVGVLRTDASAFAATVTSKEVEADVPFAFRNTTGATVELHGCIRPNPPWLERQVGDTWETAYIPVVLMCLSPPVRLAHGHLYRDTLHATAGRPGSGIHPPWEGEVSGTYRLRWRTGADADVTEVYSNPFTLTAD